MFVKFIQRVKNLSKSEHNDASFSFNFLPKIVQTIQFPLDVNAINIMSFQTFGIKMEKKEDWSTICLCLRKCRIVCKSQIPSQPNQRDTHGFSLN